MTFPYFTLSFLILVFTFAHVIREESLRTFDNNLQDDDYSDENVFVVDDNPDEKVFLTTRTSKPESITEKEIISLDFDKAVPVSAESCVLTHVYSPFDGATASDLETYSIYKVAFSLQAIVFAQVPCCGSLLDERCKLCSEGT